MKKTPEFTLKNPQKLIKKKQTYKMLKKGKTKLEMYASGTSTSKLR